MLRKAIADVYLGFTNEKNVNFYCCYIDNMKTNNHVYYVKRNNNIDALLANLCKVKV